MPDGFRPGNLVATPDGGRRALSERNRGTRVEIERAGARPIRLGPPVRRGAAMSCSSWRVAGGGPDGREACGDWSSCSSRIRPYSSFLALFGPLLMVT